MSPGKLFALIGTLLAVLAVTSVYAAPPGADLDTLLAQPNQPKRGECVRVCETERTNCIRGCFGMPTIEQARECALQCDEGFDTCARDCTSGALSMAGLSSCGSKPARPDLAALVAAGR
jgi:hypothetical protein